MYNNTTQHNHYYNIGSTLQVDPNTTLGKIWDCGVTINLDQVDRRNIQKEFVNYFKGV